MFINVQNDNILRVSKEGCVHSKHIVVSMSKICLLHSNDSLNNSVELRKITLSRNEHLMFMMFKMTTFGGILVKDS